MVNHDTMQTEMHLYTKQSSVFPTGRDSWQTRLARQRPPPLPALASPLPSPCPPARGPTPTRAPFHALHVTALHFRYVWLQRHEHAARHIGTSARHLGLKYFSRDALDCYWWRLMVEQAKLIRWAAAWGSGDLG